jgi:dipeptidyl aminopeptidase/acylaminoacyl peptidase
VTISQKLNAIPGATSPDDDSNSSSVAEASSSVQTSSSSSRTGRPAAPPGAYEPQTLFRHGGPVYAMAFSPSGNLLAAGGRGSTIDVWAQDQPAAARWSVPERSVYALAWSPDGRLLATAGPSGVVRIWDAATHSQVRTLSGHSGPVRALSWAHTGALLASGGDDGTVRLWDAGTGGVRKVLPMGPLPVGNVSFNPEGSLLAASAGLGGDGSIRVWEPASGKQVQEITTRLSLLQPLAWSPDGKELAIGQHRGAGVWDVSSGREVRTIDTKLFYALALAWSDDGHVLLSTGNQEVWVIGPRDEKKPLSWRTEKDHPLSLAAKPNGADFASAAASGLVQLWKAPANRK